jgi:iron complex outermembrane receptor protein
MSLLNLRAQWAVLPVAALVACSSLAQPAQTLASVRVTATRVPEDPKAVAAGVTVVDAAAVRAMGATSVNEAIRWLAGVSARAGTSGGSDLSLDLRGFGETAGSNLVVLVDGVRQNEGDFSASRLSWLPVESVQRIEILRGSASVLHGEGATGGVINVVTSQGLDSAGAQVSLGLGSNGNREARAAVSGAQEALHWQLSAAALESDQHRENFDHQERNGVARLTWDSQGTLLTARLGVQTSEGGLPGGLTPAEASQNPWQSFTPLNRGETESGNLLLGAEFNLAGWRMALDASRRVSDVMSNYVSDGYQSQVSTTSSRQGVRGWRSYATGAVTQRTLLGVDVERWDSSRDSQASWGDSQTAIHQQSSALYARQEVAAIDQRWRVFAGARRTLAERAASGTQSGRIDPNNTSWEWGSVVALPQAGEMYARMGTSFRLPNADEFSCYVGFGACGPNTVSLLKPQTSKDLELGWRQTDAGGSRAVRVYRSALRNEVGLDASQFNNVNYDPTLRQGVEAEWTWQATPATRLGAVLNLRSAKFEEGAYAGKQVPLVSARTLTLQWMQQLGERQSLSWMTQIQSSQRIAGDLDNTCTDRLGGFGQSRVRYAHQLGDWQWALTVNNVLDRQYVNYRTRCDATKRSVYPEAGRTWLLTTQRQF